MKIIFGIGKNILHLQRLNKTNYHEKINGMPFRKEGRKEGKKEGRNYFLSMLPALAVIAFFSFAFSEAPAPVIVEVLDEAPPTKFNYENESNCTYKLQIYMNGSACGTTIGTVGTGSGSIPFSFPCTGTLTGVRLLGLSAGAPDVPASGPHPCSSAETIYTGACNSGTYEAAFNNCGQVKIYEV